MDNEEKDLVSVIEKIADWKAKDCEYSRVPGGKTNPNWQVTVDGKKFFVKIPGAGTEIFIDRKNCHQANLIAQNTGIGPGVFKFFDL
jgi:fructosamine-3-kinase